VKTTYFTVSILCILHPRNGHMPDRNICSSPLCIWTIFDNLRVFAGNSSVCIVTAIRYLDIQFSSQDYTRSSGGILLYCAHTLLSGNYRQEVQFGNIVSFYRAIRGKKWNEKARSVNEPAAYNFRRNKSHWWICTVHHCGVSTWPWYHGL